MRLVGCANSSRSETWTNREAEQLKTKNQKSEKREKKGRAAG
jgi:hypothetical protein